MAGLTAIAGVGAPAG
ncbi:MAG: hypothetical protein P8Y63_05320 [Deltaproteobacteria bacterium]